MKELLITSVSLHFLTFSFFQKSFIYVPNNIKGYHGRKKYWYQELAPRGR